MADRPVLDKDMDSRAFQDNYYLKEELVQFCRQEGLQTTGGKIELNERIVRYLDTKEKITSPVVSRRSPDIGDITESSVIENNLICSEKHRAFFRQAIGERFTFNVMFQKWLRNNAGRSYEDAIQAYCGIIAESGRGRTVIGEQFEYNAYIRDFFADNSGRGLNDAIKCWKYKKSITGHKRYERSDLVALEEPREMT